jgi:transposase
MRPDEAAEEHEQFSLPADLTQWIEPTVLMEWVEEEVEKLEWNQPEVEAYLKHHPDYRPKIMLGLLVYAYATQVLGSDEIAGRCYSDTIFRLISRGEAPSASELMRFRRENRGLLRGMLYQVFVRAIQEHHSTGSILLPPGLKRGLLDSAVERLDIARHMDSLDE